MATDLISVFLRTEPFSLRFPYVFGVLEFFFDTEYYAILMSNYFTLAQFPYVRTTSTIPSFLLVTQVNNWFSFKQTSNNWNSFPSLQHAAALARCSLTYQKAV